MNYSCSINRVSFFAYHGVYAEERTLGAQFFVTIEAQRKHAEAIDFRNLEQLYNYEFLFATAEKHMKQTQMLIETVAKAIFDELSESMDADSLTVEISKPNPAGVFGSGEAIVTIKK
jgi:dihydroneopterin aldolase